MFEVNGDIVVNLVGTGNAFCEEGKFQACYWFQFNNKDHQTNILVDCGATSLTEIKKQRVGLNSLKYIFITHFLYLEQFSI